MNCVNCSGQNKNNVVLWYCAWWTMHRLHHNLDLHFLIIDHLEFAPNWCFGLIKQRFTKTRVDSLSEIASIVKDSTVTAVNIPQLVGLEDGTVLVESYGWQQHLTLYFRLLPQIKLYQHFRSLVMSPKSVRTVRTRFQLLRNADILPPIDSLPAKAPPGLDTARQTVFLGRLGTFATKRLWTSHALHQSQGQDRNRLSEYRFPCSCVVWTDQSSALICSDSIHVTLS
ncbi:uncharacterized protein LOC121840507 [Oncorhynchus tshawytscha]|uniref:uncharacterized protein LOC121840507 n=1 Tax=Oncorhynchus tshawytscha TaxID=74940 RepID=UPI001C3C3BCD|nr:uncharacterized protein LOC121840507 [Oncorhynchus tshawytscha]